MWKDRIGSVAAGAKSFWRDVTEGLTLQELWRQFRRETGASYRLYTAELEGRFEDLPQRRRWLHVSGAIARAMLLKLSPPRRVFLLLAVVLLVWGFQAGEPLATLAGTLGVLGLLGLELADRVAMKRDLQIAREIQGWLVPQTPPRVPGTEIAFATRPANTVAGDYYDALLRPMAPGGGEQLLLVVADVAGKGMPAALLMATFQSSLRTLLQEALPLTDLVARLNRYCCDHSLDGRRFTTALHAQLDRATGRLAYVNAGHNPPALRRVDGRIETLEVGGLPLGIQADTGYESGSVTLEVGDLLTIYTDGVVEARNAAGEEYGEARLNELLQGSGGATAAQALERLLAAVDAFIGDAPRFDDITCMMVRRTAD